MQQASPENPGASGFEQAIVLFGESRLEEAEAACRQVLAAEPRHPHALHMLGLIRAEAGAVEEGLVLVERALATGVVHPAIEHARGRLLMRLGRDAEAVTSLQRSLQLMPRQPEVTRLLAVALMQSRRVAEAEAVLAPALTAGTDAAGLLDALAMVRMMQGRYPEAQALLEKALSAEPEHADALGNLALVYEQSNRVQDATGLVAQGLARWPGHGTLRLTEARLLRRAGDHAAARRCLLALRDAAGLLPALARDLEFELGWCADGLDDAGAAMAHFVAANAASERLTTVAPALQDVYPRQLAALARLYGSLPAQTAAAAAEPGTPAFLMGFPRSGTTLLDTMLDAHGGFAVLEEPLGIQRMLDLWLSDGREYPAGLPQLAPEFRVRLRDAHAEVCRRVGWDGQRPVLDKSPFATAHVGLLQAVFPGTPIVFLARHPCDVVLSCYMHGFEINSGTVHFTRLDSTVALYCGVMELWKLYREKLPLNFIQLRYEDLVREPEAELRRLLAFLGAEWSPKVLAHEQQALKRGRIPTPSYRQVSQPLYRHAAGRWRRYTRWLEPHLPRLEPFIRDFGYDA